RLPGQPYHYAGNLCTTNWKSKVSVQYHSVLDAFTIIKAKVPKDWKDGPIVPFRPISDGGYATFIGPGQFFECKQNMIDPDHALDVCIRPGRPATIPSSGRGRKRRTPTRKSLEKLRPTKRRKILEESLNAKPMEEDKENYVESVLPLDTQVAVESTRRLTRSSKPKLL
ncbi:hypothetical protein CVT26_014381, partial [Gymnopilus dilepis]